MSRSKARVFSSWKRRRLVTNRNHCTLVMLSLSLKESLARCSLVPLACFDRAARPPKRNKRLKDKLVMAHTIAQSLVNKKSPRLFGSSQPTNVCLLSLFLPSKLREISSTSTWTTPTESLLLALSVGQSLRCILLGPLLSNLARWETYGSRPMPCCVTTTLEPTSSLMLS